MGKQTKWNLDMRLVLQNLLRQDYTLTKIRDMWQEADAPYNSISLPLLSTEVRKGLTEDEIKERRFARYDITRVYESIIGKDAIDYIKSHNIMSDS